MPRLSAKRFEATALVRLQQLGRRSTPWGFMMKRMHRKKLSLAVAQALGAGIFVGLAAPAALGQVPAPAPGTPGYVEKLTVTGTRIPSANLESTSPITTVTATDIKLTAPISVENLLNMMPQVVADQGNMVSNG